MNFIIKELPDSLLSDVRRVNVLWIGRLGDLLIATPVLRSIRQRFSKARVALIVGEKGVEAAALCPGVDEILVLRTAAHPLANLALLRELRRPAELLIDLNSAFSRASFALTALAKARVKLAFDKGKARRAFTHLLEAPAEKEHMLDRYGRLAAALRADYEPTPWVRIPEDDRRRAKSILDSLGGGEPGDRRVAVHPGNFKKYDNRWPEERFVELTNRLLDEKGVRIFFMAGPGEREAVENIVARLKRPVPIVPPMPVGVTAGFLSLMDLLIVNATGTAHLAVAVGTPTFSFLSRYTKTVWMPRTGPHFAIVSDSWASCREIPVEAAWRELQSAHPALFRQRTV